MSTQESLQPQQFGKLTIERDPTRYRTVTATTPSGRNAGYLFWEKPGEHNGNTPTITSVKVSSQFRRKGVATAMLEHARQYEPDLQHSHALLPDGEAWAKARP
jgi:ribosomal protein S18 acetylase RimI-like enzyme